MMNVETLRQLSADDFASLGLGEIAYVRPARLDGHQVWAVYAANGRQVAIMPSRESAWAALVQNDLEVATVH
jgi:hypothetical protein